MECQFCHKQFGVKGTLIKHQQTAKFCIKIQEKLAPKKEKVFNCSGCKKELSCKQTLQIHQKKCEKYIENNKVMDLEKQLEMKDTIIEQANATIVKLETRVRELELDMKDVAIKSKGKITTTNTYIQQNFTPITDEKLKQDALRLTQEHLALGRRGVANYAVNSTSLKDNIVCTDASRGHYKYRDQDGDIIIDPYSHTIIKRVCESLKEPAEKINLGVKSQLKGDTPDAELLKAVKIDETSKEIRHAADGLENDLTREFTKSISSGAVKKIEV